MSHPSTHTAADIQAVAAGLMVLTDVANAAAQLERLYGRARAEAALLPLASRIASASAARVAEVVPAARAGMAAVPSGPRPGGTSRPPRAALAAGPGRIATTRGRRGSRPGDWL